MTLTFDLEYTVLMPKKKVDKNNRRNDILRFQLERVNFKHLIICLKTCQSDPLYQVDDLAEGQVKGHIDGPATVWLLPGVV